MGVTAEAPAPSETASSRLLRPRLAATIRLSARSWGMVMGQSDQGSAPRWARATCKLAIKRRKASRARSTPRSSEIITLLFDHSLYLNHPRGINCSPRRRDWNLQADLARRCAAEGPAPLPRRRAHEA